MADWKGQMSCNYNSSYHSYAYGLKYQQAPEQIPNLSGWGEPGVPELGNYNHGMPQAYYGSTAKTGEDSSPNSPEEHAATDQSSYQNDVVYLGESQAGRLFLGEPHRSAYDVRTNEARRAGSDSPSDSDAHTSPDSWRSSSSSREGSLPQADPATWAKNGLDEETNSMSPDANRAISSTLSLEPQNLSVTGNESINNYQHVPVLTPNKQSTTAVNNAKGKARTAFSENQMYALVQRFSMQRYLTPAEMKNMAEVTGLTYKQVKTWFQNRRMKLRRHQKDNSWVTERYTNKGNLIPGAIFPNTPQHMQTYQGEAHIQHYNQGMVDMAAFKKTAPQNLALYLAATGSAGYPSWPPTSSQTVAPNRPQASWPMPPAVNHYEYKPNVFNSAPIGHHTGHEASFDVKDGESVHGRNALLHAPYANPIMPNVDQ